MTIYPTRYKARKEEPGKVIVKVEGGYIAMRPGEYHMWKRQR